MKPEPVRCACGTLFGYATGDTLAIKHRDLYRLFKGGSVEGPCRRCGATVRWEAKASR
jgi:hypothetical protein